MKKLLGKGGYTLAELLVYAVILSVLCFLVADSLVIMSRTFLSLRVNASTSSAANDLLERMIRDLRAARALDDVGSTYGQSEGALALTLATTTARYSLSSGVVSVSENGAAAEVFSSPTVYVDSLIFRKAAASTTVAVSIELVLRDVRAASSTERYYSTALLRGSY